MIKTIYLNIEDDVPTIASKTARVDSSEIVLVFPKRSFLFADPELLIRLKRQTDLQGKVISILTMDEAGQTYARHAGFKLKTDQYMTRPVRKAPEGYTAEVPVLPTRRLVKKLVKRPVLKRPVEVESTTPLRVAKSSPFVLVSEKRAAEEHVEEKKKRKRNTWKIFLGFLLPIVLVGTLVVVFVLPQGKVVIYPKTDTIIRDLEISAGTGITEADLSRMTLPAERLTKTLSLEGPFESTGKKEVGTKAIGKVRIMNLTGKPISLRAGTTTLTLGTKKYAFTQDQNYIRNISPSSIQTGDYQAWVADITAIEGGEDFNIPGGTRLEITNQVFGNQPQVLYAKTETSILGGTSRFISVVGEEDLKKAQDSLTSKIIEQIRADLTSEGKGLPERGLDIEVLEFVTDKPVLTESPNFNATLKITAKGLVFQRSGLVGLVESRIVRSLPEGYKLQGSIDENLTIKSKSLNNDTGIVVLDVRFEGKSSAFVKTDGIEQEILGKGRDQVSELLLERPEVERIDIILSPSWQKAMPKFASKIKVTVEQ